MFDWVLYTPLAGIGKKKLTVEKTIKMSLTLLWKHQEEMLLLYSEAFL